MRPTGSGLGDSRAATAAALIGAASNRLKHAVAARQSIGATSFVLENDLV